MNARGPGPGVKSSGGFLAKLGPEDCRSQREVELAWGKGSSVCKGPAVGWSEVHSGSGKMVHWAEEERREGEEGGRRSENQNGAQFVTFH